MRKIAFLVANDTFPKDPSIPPLRFTQNDARELAAVLEDRETCGFETRVYLNRPSQEVLTNLDQVSGEVGQDDTLLFYYSGHGKLRGNELCLVSNETTTTSLGATSIRTRLVLEYLQGSLARRRILILDCCHSGAIASVFKAVDSESALAGLANSFGSYILTASTTIELAEEREKDGHGVFTKALIDCLREGSKERITINDLYEYAHSRLKISAKQTPLFWALQQEGAAVEIGNYQAKHERERQRKREQLEREHQLERERLERERQLERERLISTARTRLGAYVALGELTEEQVEDAVALLKRDEARLFPRDRRYRDDLIRFSKGEASFLEVFGAKQYLRPEPAPKPPENEVSLPITSPEAPVVDAPIMLFEPPAIDQPVTPPEPPVVCQPVTPPEPTEIGQTVAPAEPTDGDSLVPPEPPGLDPRTTPSASEVLAGTGGGGELLRAKKSSSVFSDKIALFIPTLVAIGVLIFAAYFFFASGTTSVPMEPSSKSGTLELGTKSITSEPGTKTVPSESGAESGTSEHGTQSTTSEPGTPLTDIVRYPSTRPNTVPSEPGTLRESVKPSRPRGAQHELPQIAAQEPTPHAFRQDRPASDRFTSQPCGLISDNSTKLQWYIGPDINMTWPEAAKWARSLTACGGGWSMPKLAELRSLFDRSNVAGTGYFVGGKHWPAHLHPIFSAIGGGSWVWLDDRMTTKGAPAFNFNQGHEVRYSATEPQFPTRAFSVRRVK